MSMSNYSRRVRPTPADAATLAADCATTESVAVASNVTGYLASRVGTAELPNCITALLKDHLAHLGNLGNIYAGMDGEKRGAACRKVAQRRWDKWHKARESLTPEQIAQLRSVKIRVSDYAYMNYVKLSPNKRERVRLCGKIAKDAMGLMDAERVAAYGREHFGPYPNCVTVPHDCADMVALIASRFGARKSEILSLALEKPHPQIRTRPA